MPQQKKQLESDFASLSQHSEIHEGSINSTQNAIETSQKADYLDDEAIQTTTLIKNNSSSGCKNFCIFLTICFLVIALVIFASLAFGCMLSKQAPTNNTNIMQKSNATSSIDNGTQAKYMEAQSIQQKKLISTLGTKIADLEFELKNLKAELEKERKKSHEIHNETYVLPSNHTTPNNSINQNSSNLQISNSTNITPNTNNKNNSSSISEPTKSNKTDSKPKFTVRSQPRKTMPKPSEIDRYAFTTSIDDVVARSPIPYTYPTPDREWSSIKKAEYQRAIRLMEVVHNVNFKGEIVLDNYNFYKTPEDKYNALTKILKEEKEFYDAKYETSKYIHDQIGICVYLPSFNNAKNRLYLRNLDSVFQQEYQNYHVVYVNDASTDGTGDYVKAYMQENQIPQEKYVIINNEKNKGNCANIYMAAHNYCNPGEIMILLDGDDVLIGRQVFSLLNAVYQKEKIALTYGQFLLVRNNMVSSGFSRDIPFQNLQNGNFRQLRGFFTSHLKTMYVDVMREIKVTDLQYANGTYYDYASDVAYMTPAVELVGTRLKFLKELNYEYRFDTGANEPHQQQIVVEQQVYQKPASKKMQSMSFADNPKTVHYD